MTQALQQTDMTLRPGKNSTSFPPAWNHGKTQTIRVPIALAEQILDYTRAVDSRLINDLFQDNPLGTGDFLEIIDRYIAWRSKNYRSTQLFLKPDISARTWDELRKLQDLLRQSPELLQD